VIEFVQNNKKTRRQSKVLIEKYRPQNVKSVILPQRFKKMFFNFIEEKEIQNIILYSNSPGVGKTTIAKALANDCNYDYIYINTSLHSGIDTLRSTIADYATVKTFDGRRKVVILDEFDYASPNLQAGLRGAIEEFYDKCRFIITANHIDRIIEPLKSRCQLLNFDFTVDDKKEMLPRLTKRLETIAEKEDIPYTDGIMLELVNNFYPDIRKMINTISEYSRQYDIIDNNIFTFNNVDDKLGSLILSLKLKDAREYILNNNYKFEDLYRYVYDNLIPRVSNPGHRVDMYILTSEYLDKATRSWDQEITFTGFMASLMEIINDGE